MRGDVLIKNGRVFSPPKFMTQTISLTQFNIQRPEKIIYDFPLSNSTDVINRIKSNGLKSFLLKADEVLEKNNIKWKYEDLTEQKFTEWLPYYKEKMEEHDYLIRATQERYQEEVEKGFCIKALFLYKNKKMVGSSIVGLKDNVASLLFKASDRITVSSRSDSSLGSLIEFLMLKLISGGRDISLVTTRSRNAFGFFNTIGYLDFRLRFGYTPRPHPEASLLDDVPVDENGSVLFYGLQNGEFSLFALQPKDEKNKKIFDRKSFYSSGIPFKEIHY